MGQAVVIGDRRKYLAALLTLDPERIPAAQRWREVQRKNPRRPRTASASAAYLQQEIEA